MANASSGNGVFYSDDNGDTWVAASADTGLATVGYGNGRFVALGWSCRARYSDDGGDTWLEATDAPCGSRAFARITHNGTRFVAVGTSGLINYSDDGLVWSAATVTANDLSGVAYNATIGQFMAVGRDNEVQVSDTGETWTELSFTPTGGGSVDFYAVTAAD